MVDAETSARLRRVRRRNTTPEQSVRRALHRLGHRYRICNRDLPGSPDIANRKRRWAVLVHGCYWHRHPGCVRTTTPTRNRKFWEAKFLANIARDRRKVEQLRALGYRVLVLWECETEDEAELTARLMKALN